MSRNRISRRIGGALALATAGWGLWTARYSLLHWGATYPELQEPLPGDDLLPDARRVATRGITIGAPPDEVWPWIAQLGQGRGGLYSYDWLENLVGCEIHSVDHLVPEWQDVGVGDHVRLHPDTALTVVAVEPGAHLVLRPRPVERHGGVDRFPFDYTWAFVLRRHPGRRTRLIVRERYAIRSPAAIAIVEPLAVVSAVMGIKQLRGIRDRATRVSRRG
ncbi:SRPBCC family protein [Intrasporangium sp.]|uniref:SRPBCC family protein n=1 Tax=Intrasporangium sp. TaxID=1925024 RepID=UPI00293A253A|nr:SRPBCC family protein [Intrasporangium sp.]MDV3219820.1 SRPBCC family protein [Intrasporangium sp.]